MLAKKRGDNRKKERFTLHASLCGRDNPLKALGSVALFSANGILYRTNDTEQFLIRALDIDEKRLGSEGHDMAASLNVLGMVYCKQGEYTKAETLLQHVLIICAQSLGPGDLLYQRTLSIREQMLGSNHPDTATIRENYNALMKQMKRKENGYP